MSSKVNNIQIKTLDELSFEDLCVEVPEQTYPALRDALRSLWAKAHHKGSARYNPGQIQRRKDRARRFSTPHT